MNPNEVHGYDGISISMWKLSASSISKPLSLLFKRILEQEYFSNKWKKAITIWIHKKLYAVDWNLQIGSLLPLWGKIFEMIIFNYLSKYLEDNNHLNSHQPRFRSDYSCVHQVLPIAYNIYKAFYANLSLEVSDIFLDLSTAFS